ncbi:D-ribose-binding periplasmic protein precursor [Peptococcaceae bacterium CEB3]|nr:D-ribose-binding periplasmic protein precursor [Peptococcaceae bacterium CEB3]
MKESVGVHILLKKAAGILTAMVLVASLVAGCGNQPNASQAGTSKSTAEKVDVSSLKSSDNQPLIQPGADIKPPQRPADPSQLPKTDIGHWYDMEWAGWNVNKVNIPKSPANGAKGKTIILIEPGEHPYFTAYTNGAQKVAIAYGMNLKVMTGDWSVAQQTQQVKEAITQRPDMIIIPPVAGDVAESLFKQINQAGIPFIASNLLPNNAAMKYALEWTGPDDWGQMKLLADKFAELMHNTGDYAIVRHMPGASPYYSRTWGVEDELLKVAPNMKVLDAQTGKLDATVVQQLVSGWLTKYGTKLKGLVLDGDSAEVIGAQQALKNANRSDVVIVAAGNSKVGMDAIKSGFLAAETYQTAEGDGALPVYEAAQWFEGKTIPPVRYLPQKIITKDNVNQFLPAQW